MPKNIKAETNVQFLTRICNFSTHGALMQMFVIDALTKHADRIVEHAEEVKAQMAEGFISGEAWVSVAKELQAELNKKYSGAVK